jgi:hypothetical protein
MEKLRTLVPELLTANGSSVAQVPIEVLARRIEMVDSVAVG